MESKNAIILCSGGIDSVTTAYYAKKKLHCNSLIILFFNYNQRTLKQERKASKKCAESLKAEFIEINLPWNKIMSQSLLNKKQKLNKIKRSELKDTKKESLKYYVPARNIIFLSYAISLADSLKISKNKIYDIFVGFKNEGGESYPDTTEKFVSIMNNLQDILKQKSKILAPLINKDKEDIISIGTKLGVSFKDTYSCYNGNALHCGCCLSCRLRQEGFYWANIPDPTKYKGRMPDFR
ncbi:7-cyano-7-deazaguanine synthase [Candidatus Pacearchaeota archaeon]|nr:7-cyano-7-deazaguanine synthase [Candidatus Pacearchaeota archaeon]